AGGRGPLFKEAGRDEGPETLPHFHKGKTGSADVKLVGARRLRRRQGDVKARVDLTGGDQRELSLDQSAVDDPAAAPVLPDFAADLDFAPLPEEGKSLLLDGDRTLRPKGGRFPLAAKIQLAVQKRKPAYRAERIPPEQSREREIDAQLTGFDRTSFNVADGHTIGQRETDPADTGGGAGRFLHDPRQL